MIESKAEFRNLRRVKSVLVKHVVKEGSTDGKVDNNHQQEWDTPLALFGNFFPNQRIGMTERDDEAKENRKSTPMIQNGLKENIILINALMKLVKKVCTIKDKAYNSTFINMSPKYYELMQADIYKRN